MPMPSWALSQGSGSGLSASRASALFAAPRSRGSEKVADLSKVTQLEEPGRGHWSPSPGPGLLTARPSPPCSRSVAQY